MVSAHCASDTQVRVSRGGTGEPNSIVLLQDKEHYSKIVYGDIAITVREEPKVSAAGSQVEPTLSFGVAIEALKRGKKVARAGWNGKGMWLVLVPGTPEAVLHPGTPYSAALPGIEVCELLPHIDMWTTNAHGHRAMLPGWLASQTDMLSEDWVLVA